MCTQLISLALLGFLCLTQLVHGQQGTKTTNSYGAGSVTFDLPLCGSEQEVRNWAGETFGKPEFFSIGTNAAKVLVIFAKAGWGRPQTVLIHVYAYDAQESVWRPKLNWVTHEPEVKAEFRRIRNELVFKSGRGEMLMRIPVRSLISPRAEK